MTAPTTFTDPLARRGRRDRFISTTIGAFVVVLLLLMTALLAVRLVHEVNPPEQPVTVYYCDAKGCSDDGWVR